MSIIGKPPAPRGHTFADVPCDRYFRSGDGEEWLKVSDSTVGEKDGTARSCNDGTMDDFTDGEPVVPLTLTPVEPEPDPAVTTDGGLLPGSFWRPVLLPGHDGKEISTMLRTTGGDVNLDTMEYWDEELGPRPGPVRALSDLEVADHFARLAGAHVVVPEEPGTHIHPDPSGARVFGLDGCALCHGLGRACQEHAPGGALFRSTPTARAASTGCTGTGEIEWPSERTWRYGFDGWRLWNDLARCVGRTWNETPSGCTADEALRGEVR